MNSNPGAPNSRDARFLGTSSLAFAAAVLVSFLSGCSPDRYPVTITLATTTSTRDSGLLDELLPEFERRSGISVRVVAVGSGQALAMGERGDADVLLTHAPELEEAFLAKGHAAMRRPVMYNDFVLVGPSEDPARIRGARTVHDALDRIAANNARFVSRGDESGTHHKERKLWSAVKTRPSGENYLQVGGGMAETLRVASELQSYTLADRATFLAQQSKLELELLYAREDAELLNHYSVLVIHPAKHSRSRHQAAREFAEFLTSPDAQQRIALFGREQFGRPVFVPTIGR